MNHGATTQAPSELPISERQYNDLGALANRINDALARVAAINERTQGPIPKDPKVEQRGLIEAIKDTYCARMQDRINVLINQTEALHDELLRLEKFV